MIFFLVSLSATLGTLPLILLYFNRFSLITLVANLICVPILGVLAIPVCLVIILAVPLSATLAEWVIEISELLVQISFSSLIVWRPCPGHPFMFPPPPCRKSAPFIFC